MDNYLSKQFDLFIFLITCFDFLHYSKSEQFDVFRWSKDILKFKEKEEKNIFDIKLVRLETEKERLKNSEYEIKFVEAEIKYQDLVIEKEKVINFTEILKKDIESSKEVSSALSDVHILREKETNLIIDNLKKEEKKLLLKIALMMDDVQLLSSLKFDNDVKERQIEKFKVDVRKQMV